MMSPQDYALAIWHAGLDAVRAEQLIDDRVHIDAQQIVVEDATYPLEHVRRICIVGAGKAAGYLAKALEAKLVTFTHCEVSGWVNIPDGCFVSTNFVKLHVARPSGINEPRPEGVYGTQQIMRLVNELEEQDLCICVLTGGGSALLPSPAPGLTLADKVSVTRLLSERGASIQEMNQVRIQLSTVKGGGLARACAASRLVTMVISDVIGDPLDLIASGPTFASPAAVSADAAALLRRYTQTQEVPMAVWEQLAAFHQVPNPPTTRCTYHLLANNALAVQCAVGKAHNYGLSVETRPPEPAATEVSHVARELAEVISRLPLGGCLVWGGEPVIHLSERSERGVGGRNQHLVLEVYRLLMESQGEFPKDVCILSGGTDGEDGPTNAAGAYCDVNVAQAIRDTGLVAAEFLHRNDSHSFFDRVGGLMLTGPTHTNVCDVRVVVRSGEGS